MTSYEKSVMRNIIYAVETGGQVYGNKDYADFTEAYTNSSIEKAITIGAGQWYGSEAKTLLNLIKQTDPNTFNSLDTAGIATDLAASDWAEYRITKTSAKAKCIVRIIDSEVGHRCQDQLVDEQMESYVNYAGSLGVTDMDAKMMCANFRHQGGTSAVTRILAKTPTPYTLDRLYAACQTDTGNQVGAYKSRQKMVYNSLKQYISNYVVTPEAAIQAAIKVAQNEVGYLEKRNGNDLDSKKGNAGDNNYTKYWRDIKPDYQGSSWCACFVTWVFDQAFGRTKTTELLKHFPYVLVAELANLFTRYANPQVGDIVMYYNGSRFYHTGLVVEVNGDQFVTIEGNTGPNAGVEDNGDGVYQKTRYNSQLPGTKFARPDYSIIKTIYGGGSGENPYPTDSWKPTGIATCTGDGVRVRQTPNGTVIGSLNKGNQFEVDGNNSDIWVHVKVAGIGVGYIHEDYVSYSGSSGNNSWNATGTATCTGDNVRVRATPDGSIIGMLNKGNRFEVDGSKSGVWVHIKVAGIGIGYLHEDYVAYDGSGSSWNKTGIAYCTGSGVYVRATPGGNILGSLDKGDSFEVDGTRSGAWIHIRVSSLGIGYMHENYVSSVSGTGSNSAVITAQNSLNSRYGAGLSVDGIWGSASNKAFISSIQKELNSIYGSGLSVDGIWGSGTASACLAHPLKRGMASAYVGVLQIGLHAHGIALSNGVDNDFGVSTEQGVRTFQASVGLSQDGIAGGNTFEKLANN